jgi:hypothetical protein
MSNNNTPDNTDYESDDSAISETEIINEQVINEIKNENNKKYQKVKDYKMIKSSDPNIEIELKRKNIRKPKKKIIIYKEDIESSDEEVEIVYKNKKAGRPKSNKIIKYKNDKNEDVDDRLDADKVEIDLTHTKDLNAKQIKLLKLQEKLTELEVVSGKKIRGTKKGEVDKRQTTKRTQKQIEATERLVLSNKMKREAKLQTKTKEMVEETIKALSAKAQANKPVVQEAPIVQQAPKYDPLNDPYL